jgi:predicted permease
MSFRDDSSREGNAQPAWRRYLRFLRADPPGDVNDELAFHLESTIDELVASGMTRDDARAAAHRKFGDLQGIRATLTTLSQERERTMDRRDLLDAVWNDVVFALRQLRKSPAFTLVAMLTLALGIGANTAIFSVVYSVLLQPLPFANGNRIVELGQHGGSDPFCCAPFGNYLTWKHEATGFEAIGATWGSVPMTLTGAGDPTPIAAVRASASYWKAVFAPPVAGRYFTEEEDRPGAANVVILSDALWRDRFSADRGIIGHTITLNGKPFTVVGIAPQDYILTPPAEQLWVPLAPPAARYTDFSDHELHVYGLLEAGVPAAVAVRQLTQIETRLAKQNPNSGYDGGINAASLLTSLSGDHRQTLFTLLGAVGLVLLIACGNIASLLMARANVRRGEIAIRGALGATQRRIMMQLLTESLLLALGGAVLGLAVGAAGMRFLLHSPVPMPRLQNVSLNGPVLAFTLCVAVICAVIFGFAPAIKASRVDLQQTLREGGRDAHGGARDRARRALVIGELCLAQVLLVGAGLLIRSSMLVQSVPAGFDTHDLLVVSLSLPNSRYPEPARQEATWQQIESSVAAIPGVEAVGRSQVAPIYGDGWSWTAFRQGSNGHDAGSVGANMRTVSASYFTALRLPILRGRSFSRADVAGSTPVAIVSLGLAKRLFGNADPIGRQIGNGAVENASWRQIVGVVADMHANGLADVPPLELYMPSTQWINPTTTLLIRGAGDVTTLVPSVKRAVAGIDPLLALSGISTMQEAIDNRQAVPRFTTWLLTLLGVTGLVLAAIGVYGIVAYGVAQRTHEFGVRMALGASVGTVQAMVLKQGVILAAVGIGLGLIVALASAHVLGALMFGVTAHDPITFTVVAGLLLAVALLACVLPARRATRIDPLEALRRS